MIKWKKIGSRKVFSHLRMQLVEDEVILPNGSTAQYLREINKKDYVTVVAQYDEKFVMVYDYSYPNNQMLLQFPEGTVDQGETPEQGAIRELEEETGLHAREMNVVGKTLNHHRRSTAIGFVCSTRDLQNTGITHLEAEESYTKTVYLTEKEISQKIATGEIIQKNTLAAWAVYSCQKNIK